MSKLEAIIRALRCRQEQEVSPENAEFQLTLIKLLAEGKPVSVQILADKLRNPIEFVSSAFQQMAKEGAEFNERGELIGAALTLSKTQHQLVVSGQILYAWCALDTLFLPAYIGKTAQISSTCPATSRKITLTVRPDGIDALEPAETVLSIVTASDCTAGIEGTFCGKVNFFASRQAAQIWLGEDTHVSILTVAEAYRLAQEIYIEPMLRQV